MRIGILVIAVVGTALAIVSGTLSLAQGSNILTENGLNNAEYSYSRKAVHKKEKTSIVIGKDAPEVVKFAAKELQTYLGKISGEYFPVYSDDKEITGKLILMGKSKYTEELKIRKEFAPDSFLIKTIGDNLILIGDDLDKQGISAVIPFDYQTSHKGSLYAVYTFLEKYFGVRWFWPGESGEVVPKKEKIILPKEVDIYEEPDFLWRHFFLLLEGTSSQARDLEIPLWYMRNKFGVTIGSPFSFSHSWAGYLTNDYFKEHPEYYALVNGKRAPFETDKEGRLKYNGSQVCTTNPDVISIFVEKIRKRYNPEDRTIASISPNDGRGFCECEKCRALDHPELYGPDEGYEGIVLSDRIFTFVNEVAKEVKKTHPNLNLGIFSYTFLLPPPRAIDKLEDNIVVSMTQIDAMFNDEAYKRKTRKRIEEWTKKCSKFVGRDYHSLCYGVIHPQTRILAEDIPYLKKKNCTGYYWEGVADFASNHLNYYVASKFLWNTNAKLEYILSDYYNKAYGKASKKIREYFTMMEDSFSSRIPKGSLYAGNIPQWYSPETIKRGYKLLNEAKEIVKDNEAIKRRIDYLLIGHQYADKATSFVRLCQHLTDSGLPVRIKGYSRKELEEIPSRETIVGWIKEAKETGEELSRFVEKHKEDGALSYFELMQHERIYMTLATIEDYYKLYGERVFEKSVSPSKIIFSEGFEEKKDIPEKGKGYKSEIVGDKVYKGQSSLHITVEYSYPNYYALTWKQILVEGGASYLFSLFYQADNVKENSEEKEKWLKKPNIPKVRIYFYDTSGKICIPVKEYIWFGGEFKKKTEKWEEIRRIFTAPPEAKTLCLTIFFQAQGDYWMDEVKIEKF